MKILLSLSQQPTRAVFFLLVVLVPSWSGGLFNTATHILRSHHLKRRCAASVLVGYQPTESTNDLARGSTEIVIICSGPSIDLGPEIQAIWVYPRPIPKSRLWSCVPVDWVNMVPGQGSCRYAI